MKSGPQGMEGIAAKKFAKCIEEYWRDRGHKISTRIETVSTGKRGGSLFCVRSNLTNGLPPSGEASK